MSYEMNPRAMRMRDEFAEDIKWCMGRDAVEGYYSKLERRLEALSNQRMPSAELHCRAVFDEAQKMLHHGGFDLLPVPGEDGLIGYTLFHDDDIVMERSLSYLRDEIPSDELHEKFAIVPSQN